MCHLACAGAVLNRLGDPMALVLLLESLKLRGEGHFVLGQLAVACAWKGAAKLSAEYEAKASKLISELDGSSD